MSALPVFTVRCPDPVSTFGDVAAPPEAVFLLSPTFRGTKRQDLQLTPRPAAPPPDPKALVLNIPGADPAPPLASAAAHAFLRDRLPREGVVSPVSPGHPAFSQVFQAARAAMVDPFVPDFGTNTPTEAARLVCEFNAEVAARAYALPESFAFGAVRQKTPALISDEEVRAIVNAISAAGITPAGALAAPLVSAAERQAADEGARKNASSAALKLLHEKIEIDLAAHDLALVEGDGARKLYRLDCFPCGDFPSLVLAAPSGVHPNGEDAYSPTGARVSVRCTGMTTVTRGMLDSVQPLPVGLMRDIAVARTENFDPTRVWVSTDFAGDARTEQGRWALEDFRRRARALVKFTVSRTTLPGYYAFISLIVAYGGAVSWSNAIAILTDVCAEYAAGGGRSRIVTYRKDHMLQGVRMPDALPPAPEPRAWPGCLPRPHTIGPEMAKALSHGRSLYAWGELLPVTAGGAVAAVVKRVFKSIEKATAEYLDGKAEVRFQAVVDAIYAEGLLPSPTVAPADRDKITGAMRAAGFEQVERERDGQRQRVWVRADAATAAAE